MRRPWRFVAGGAVLIVVGLGLVFVGLVIGIGPAAVEDPADEDPAVEDPARPAPAPAPMPGMPAGMGLVSVVTAVSGLVTALAGPVSSVAGLLVAWARFVKARRASHEGDS